tara:strand:- start:10623 stop:11690 length:1068 start_codon:yes stop_codon:yes gene_type:complete
MDNWTVQEVVSQYQKEITSWRAEGLGRGRCRKKIMEMSGRVCTDGCMQRVFQILNKRMQNISIEEEQIDDGEVPLQELIENKLKASERKKKKFQLHNRTLTLPAQPFGLLIFGDPHIDNDGCDFATLSEHVRLAQTTEGVLCATVGDINDNWVGRLSQEYAKSSILATDGWRLSEWFLNSAQWIAVVGGNHDLWQNSTAGFDPLKMLSKTASVQCYAPDELRITLQFKSQPEIDPIIWIIRHDFSGRSWYHPTHGPHKEAMLDGQCHILTAGHIHQWGQLTTEQRHGRVTHAIRVRGYKQSDGYAKTKGFFEQKYGMACLLVINPIANEPQKITVFWDIESGCNYLSHLRQNNGN